MQAWLRSAGLSRLADSFSAHGITRDQLPELTDEDLRELGLTIGERKLFRRALRGQTAPPFAPSPPPPTTLPVSGTASVTLPERRPLTVVFVDLVDSVGLGERLEIEDLLEVLRLYRECCGAAIGHYGGSVAGFSGDGVLAHFCYPVAHENDAERAVRAALRIVGELADLATPAGTPLRARVGIATGRVVVTDLMTRNTVDLRAVAGSTPNLAARLQAFAPAGGVVISEPTHERVGGLFACDDLGPREIRGFTAPQRAFQVLRALPGAPARARPAAPLTPLFGREEESAALRARWAQALRGRGGVALVCGEAGIGKSRLVEGFLAAPGGPGQDAPGHTVRIAASAFDRDSPLRPFLAHVRLLAGLEGDDPAHAKLDKLAAALRGPETDRAAHLPVLAGLLRVWPGAGSDAETASGTGVEPAPGTPSPASLPPALLRERELRAVAGQLLAADGPLCLVVEDLHWLDPTSHSLLESLAREVAERPVLLLLTARDAGEHAALTGPDALVLRLRRLEAGGVAGMVRSLFGDVPVPDAVLRGIARKTDGIPLFVEEYLRPLLRARDRGAGAIGPDWSGFWSGFAGDEGDPVAIPASLHEALMARLDRSGPAKELAQVAAVVGRIARRDMLGAVSGLPDAGLDAALAALGEAGVLHPYAHDGRDCYQFAHALLRDAAYDSILRDRRRELHRRVAQALAALDPDGVELQPELLAHHLTEGGRPDEAVSYWLRAGRRVVQRFALLEAVRLLRRGLAAAEALPPTPAGLERRLQMLSLLGPALIALRGPGAAEVQSLYADAYALAQQTRESRSHFPVLWGWWQLARDFQSKRQRATALLARARERDDPELLLQAHHCNWATHYDAGELCRCHEHIVAGLAIYGAGEYGHHAALYGSHDARVCAHGELAQLHWMQGRLRDARIEEARALDWAGRLAHAGSRAHAMDMALLHRSYRRDHAGVLALAGELIAFAAEQGLADHRAKGLLFRGWATALGGEAGRGLDALEAGLGREREIGTIGDLPVYLCLYADALMAAGRAAQAVDELTRARAEFEAVGLRVWLPELWRSLGAAILAADPAGSAPTAATDAAARAFRTASALAEEQGAVMLGLRAAVSEAELAAHLGDPEGAFSRLRAASRAVPDGANSPEAASARALLRALAERLHLRSDDSCPGGR